MKSPDHNGEDNFARDFMVSLCLRCRLISPAPQPPTASPGRAGAASALCAVVRRGAEGAYRPGGPDWPRSRRGARSPPPVCVLSSLPGLDGPLCPSASLSVRPGRSGSGRGAKLAPSRPLATTYCFSGRDGGCAALAEQAGGSPVGARRPSICPSRQGRGRGSGCDPWGHGRGCWVGIPSWGPLAHAGLRVGKVGPTLFLGSRLFWPTLVHKEACGYLISIFPGRASSLLRLGWGLSWGQRDSRLGGNQC
jgi:hypothetical protein